jgi:hypothetical protein
MQYWLSGVGVGLIVGVLVTCLLWGSSPWMGAQWRRLVCRVRGHEWDYFGMTNLDGTPADLRCCLRCELSEDITHDVYVLGKYGNRYDGATTYRMGRDV